MAMGGRPCRGRLDRRPQGQCPAQGPASQGEGVCSHASPGPGALVVPQPLPHGPADPLPVLVSPSPSEDRLLSSCSSCPIPREDCHPGDLACQAGVGGVEPCLSLRDGGASQDHAHPVWPGSGGHWLARSHLVRPQQGVAPYLAFPAAIFHWLGQLLGQTHARCGPRPQGPRAGDSTWQRSWATRLSAATRGSGAAALPAGVQALSKDPRRHPQPRQKGGLPAPLPRGPCTAPHTQPSLGCRVCEGPVSSSPVTAPTPAPSSPRRLPPPHHDPRAPETGGEALQMSLHFRRHEHCQLPAATSQVQLLQGEPCPAPAVLRGRDLPAQAWDQLC
ncbi:histone acetyltransferase p300-like [Bubalus bubalis]|uniref:histone acetyltransferase p300-like n=1 Tax=Bubalus bubalis TaxID=89462 RepID=UPI001D12959E|nr:histone acetyltransferase p300-like [Bubalus bubalis]